MQINPKEDLKKEHELFKKLRDDTLDALKANSEWYERAKMEYSFFASDQHSESEKQRLNYSLDVPITVNRVAPIINSVVGTEINNRTEIQFLRREEGDQVKSEIMTSAGEWFRDVAHAEENETDAFRDALICGVGVTDTWLDFEEDSEGAPKIRRGNPLEYFWDQHAELTNMEDARFIGRMRKMSIEDARLAFPDYEDSQLDADWIDNKYDDHDKEYDENGDETNIYHDASYNKKRQRVRIVQIEWRERQPYYLAVDPQTGEQIEVKKRLLSQLKENDIPYIELSRWKYKRAFLGQRKILWSNDSPIQGEFSIQTVTAYRDTVKKQYYGMMRALMDPQRLANKSLQQVIKLIDSSAKGGLMVEKKAMGDRADEIAQSWAANDEITVFEDEALSGGMVQPKPQTGLNPAYLTLFEIASNAKQLVSGVSAEMMGLRDTTQAASLELQRRQATMTILAPLFDNLRYYRKRQAAVMLHLIQNDMSDGRLIRVLGDSGDPKYVPLIREEDSLEYDIILEESPVSPNQKERIWSYVERLVNDPTLPPEIKGELLQYSPLPSRIAAKLAQSIVPPQADPQQAQLAQQAAVIELEDKQAETEETLSKARLNEVKRQEIEARLVERAQAAATQSIQQQIEAELLFNGL